jgi:hypothetical protein
MKYVSENTQHQISEEINEETECLNSDQETVSAAEVDTILRHADSYENAIAENSEQCLLVDCMISGSEVPTNKANQMKQMEIRVVTWH